MPLSPGLVAAVLVSLTAASGCRPSAAEPERPAEAPIVVPAGRDVRPTPTRPPAPPLPEGFSYLADAAPEIGQEMRYATAFNFVGERIDGYHAPVCILTTEAAEALARVDADLAAHNLGLKVYDCYRPQAAVDHFVRWARSGQETMKRGFYPTEPTATLFRRGYIATRSGHTRGSTVDLTLVRRPPGAAVQDASRYPDPAGGPLPRCDRNRDGSADARFDDGDLDMGTAFDCLSPRAATAARGIPAAARRNRETLRAAMERRGFENYSKEWWHFTLRPEPFPRTYHTFPVE
ncbi:MAG TPA: M15 family metallopeptidase [Rubricoccaceae bacterium]|jgi:D-alanyl-D-alanine dipeptidase